MTETHPTSRDGTGQFSMRALVIEDDLMVFGVVSVVLRREGYSVLHAAGGVEGIDLASNSEPDAVVLDLTLPDVDGMEVCRSIRPSYGGPIVVLSGDSREETIVAALDAGADDFVAKPFRAAELLARLRAAARRAHSGVAGSKTVEIDRLRIDLSRRTVHASDREIAMTRTEFDILALLAAKPNHVISIDEILNKVWGPHHGDYAQAVRVHVGKIRRKIEVDPAAPRYLTTVIGMGYRLRSSRAAQAAEF